MGIDDNGIFRAELLEDGFSFKETSKKDNWSSERWDFEIMTTSPIVNNNIKNSVIQLFIEKNELEGFGIIQTIQINLNKKYMTQYADQLYTEIKEKFPLKQATPGTRVSNGVKTEKFYLHYSNHELNTEVDYSEEDTFINITFRKPPLYFKK